MALESAMKSALERAFAPTSLTITNESYRHAGHAGDDGSGESHWTIHICAPCFAPMTRIARHRAIHAALGPEIIGRIHALAITAE